MRIFDQIDAAAIERREWHLWVLASAMILILASGMALLMYPAVFSNPLILSGPALRKSFFGFCALSFLLVGYLLDRHWVIRQLRKALTEEQIRNIHLRRQASVDLLESLPQIGHFQDRLVMDFRRAASTQQPLSLLTVSLIPLHELSDAGEISAAFGDAAKALLRRLRAEDSMYIFQPGVFGIILPGVSAKDAYGMADRLAEGLRDAAGASNRFSSDLRVINYPEHVEGAREMEEMARAALPAIRPDAGQIATRPTLNEAPRKS